jgi:hypothetical protein
VRKGIGYHPIFCQYIKYCKRQSPRIIIPGPHKNIQRPKFQMCLIFWEQKSWSLFFWHFGRSHCTK